MSSENIDSSSIASDYSIIPDNLVNVLEEDAVQARIGLDLNVSTNMIKSITDDLNEQNALSTSTKQERENSLENITFGTIQRVNNNPEGDLAVVFISKQDYVLKSSDRIALYKTGFTSPKDFLSFTWVPITSSQYDSLSQIVPSIIVPFTVIFPAADIPKDKSEFYQFCYLSQDGQIAGVSVPFQLEQVDKSNLVEIENVARNVLALRVNDLMEERKKLIAEVSELKEKLQEKQENIKTGDDSFEIVANFDAMTQRTEELEKKLLMVSKELVEVEAEREAQKVQSNADLEHKEYKILEITEKYSLLVTEHNELRQQMMKMNEEKEVSLDRQKVVVQDHEDLKARLQLLSQDLENAFKEKEAAQKIASHLSDNNMKMAKKIENLMRVERKILDAVTTEGFKYVKSEEGGEETMCSEAVSEMAESVVSAHSSCAKEIQESLGLKLDTIMKQLRELNIEKQKSLSFALQNPEENLSVTSDAPSVDHTVVNIEEEEKEEEEEEEEKEKKEEEPKPLYENSFLPTQTTAPVFLPPSAPSMTDQVSNSMLGSYSIISSASATTQTDLHSVSMSATQTIPVPVAKLPPPLQPETTATARNAAVLGQFNEVRNHESDDDDFHSTSDAGENGGAHRASNDRLFCPLCNLTFQPSALSLLNEHIDSHLEKICPICSKAFSRTYKQDEFESHVQSHFTDVEATEDDPSGPWDPSRSGNSGFHLLEID